MTFKKTYDSLTLLKLSRKLPDKYLKKIEYTMASCHFEIEKDRVKLIVNANKHFMNRIVKSIWTFVADRQGNHISEKVEYIATIGMEQKSEGFHEIW